MADRGVIRRKLASARSYSGAEISLVPAALLLLALARLAIALLPPRAWIGWLGNHAQTSGQTAPAGLAADRRARSIGRSVRATAAAMPWRADCLPQAMAALALLRLARIPYRLSIGWRDDGDSLIKQPMLAHAWLEAGNRIVTGAPIQPELKPRLVFEG